MTGQDSRSSERGGEALCFPPDRPLFPPMLPHHLWEPWHNTIRFREWHSQGLHIRTPVLTRVGKEVSPEKTRSTMFPPRGKDTKSSRCSVHIPLSCIRSPAQNSTYLRYSSSHSLGCKSRLRSLDLYGSGPHHGRCPDHD